VAQLKPVRGHFGNSLAVFERGPIASGSFIPWLSAINYQQAVTALSCVLLGKNTRLPHLLPKEFLAGKHTVPYRGLASLNAVLLGARNFTHVIRFFSIGDLLWCDTLPPIP